MKQERLFTLVMIMLWATLSFGAQKIPLTVENPSPGAPLTFGIPFPIFVLHSPDHVRVLDKNGKEIPSQITEVSTWEPADQSIKWIWVFFFAGDDNEYFLEYGKDVNRTVFEGDKIKVINGQRPRQLTEVDTGPLHFKIRKGEGGFLDLVQLDLERDGFDKNDTIAVNPSARGSFLDLFDDAGIDPSKAVVTRTVKEKGSGPLHSILKVEGTYFYEREDNRPSPFIIRIHSYAGKSFIRVFHTMTYTGIPDKHEQMEGQHIDIATGLGKELPAKQEGDEGWTQPNDQISGLGLGLTYHLNGKLTYRTGYKNGKWWEDGTSNIYENKVNKNENISVFQTGPETSRTPPTLNSSSEEMLTGFKAQIKSGASINKEIDKVEGWADISDSRWGISVGVRNFIEEYPKEIDMKLAENQLVAYLWSPKADPMSFARASDKRDSGMTGNFATGLTKTSELVYNFHSNKTSTSEIQRTMKYFLDPPIAHADPTWYAQSEVYGKMSSRGTTHAEYERSLDYKMDWAIYNQHYEPWYGMFDYGDHQYFYIRGDWRQWLNNEPAVDYMLWLQFMRTGNRKYFLAAEAMSRHTMDVDNIHWPTNPNYIGDSNSATDFWKFNDQEPVASPYLGIGRRHARQQWTSLLSAHVWVQGWLSSYYLTGYHRGLDVAKQTADTYTKRIWGDHGITGRRLYLSVWNMVEVWDATKDPKYLKDLQGRVDQMLKLQNGPDQYNSLVIDRYGYAQVYASQSLYKYYRMTGDEKIKTALVRHARAIRDNPPWNHAYESYLSTIHSLLVGYELTGEPSFLKEAKSRSAFLKTDKMEMTFEEIGNQAEIAKALEEVSNMPKVDVNKNTEGRRRTFYIWDMTQGMRVFGWTHAYNVPWLLHWLRTDEKVEAEKEKH